MKVTLDELSNSSNGLRQTWKRSNKRRKTMLKSLPILSSPPYKPNNNERPREKRRMKQTSSPEEIILLSEPTDRHLKSTGAKINDRFKIKVAELQGIVKQLKIEKKLAEEKLKAMEERVRQLNTKSAQPRQTVPPAKKISGCGPLYPWRCQNMIGTFS